MNDLSAFSYKARTRECSEVSVLYAYDIELMEPVCAEVFPGNSIDTSSYPTFIRDNDIRKGIIVADKGFPPGRIREEPEKRPDLHFLTPLKRNDARISDNGMLSFEGVLDGIGTHVLYLRRNRSKAVATCMLLRIQKKLHRKKRRSLQRQRTKLLMPKGAISRGLCSA